ncbi:hypothetical protein F1C16_21175 (plasmid) [Hymenobacter sp. NBH84]|uniref:hypothetical protein n=1 Tax=Hymenobacter sp. NBH84 TaxID=2596915 RepID=UPI0016237105|nr:hypothetical protein [Hymenobacter sp. NBH84]QNE42136.1 hypothetical protein F1C16_21175 [Hymenobacter sp. NBH84]
MPSKKARRKVLSTATQTELARQQKVVDNEPTFAAQVAKAQTRWKSKESGQSGKHAFAEIKQQLRALTISTQACSYCEYSEGEDIEHIYPKSWFPQRTFVWDNYLLACKTCNTSFKRNGFAVFNPAGSSHVLHLTPQVAGPVGSTDAVLLNPLVENPLDWLIIDFQAGCAFAQASQLSTRDQKRADYTIELLQLNFRAELSKARRIAHRHFIGLLREYVEVKLTTTLAQLAAAVNEPHVVDLNQPFRGQRARIMASLRRAIRTHPHPAVWQELQRQQLTMPQAAKLFQDAPEALIW